MKPDQSRLTTLLTDTVNLLCKNGLNFQASVRIEGVLGITVDDSDVFIVHLNESISNTVETPNVMTTNVASDRTTETNEDGDAMAENQTLLNSWHSSRKSRRLTNCKRRAAMISSKDELQSTVSSVKDTSIMAPEAESANCSSSESSGQMDVCIKEESADDDGDNVLTGTGNVCSDKDVETFKCEKETSFRCRKGKKQDPQALPTDNCTVTGDVFSANKEIKVEAPGSDCYVDPLVLSNLHSGTDHEASPWIDYAWNGGSYGADYPPVDAEHAWSQGLVPSSQSFVKRRSLKDCLDNPDMQQQFRHGNVAMLKPFACPVAGCNRRFFHRNNVYRHRKQKHGENIVEFDCTSRRW